MADFVVAHGAWSAAWSWKKMRPLMRALGHELITPTYTGLGERAHLARPDIDLETHIADILGVLDCEDLRGVVLVGHSYGGMVATAVADRAPERIAQLVYLDAFVPRNGESLAALRGGAASDSSAGADWRAAPNPLPADTDPADIPWIAARRMAHPRRCFEQPVVLSGAVERIQRTYIYCTRPAPGDGFRRFADRARREPGWNCLEIDSSHSPHITAPEALAALLDGIARRSPGSGA